MKLSQKHFINLEDFSSEEILGLLDFAEQLKAEVKAGKATDVLRNKTLVMYFSKPSLRTRLSFEIGMKKLGGTTVVLKQDEVILGQRESIEDTSRVVSRYADGITIRTFAHSDVETFAQYSSIPVINSLTDLSHPCQILADLLTVKEYFKTFSGRKLAYIGDGNNVANTLLIGCALVGMDISIATPVGYEPDTKSTETARRIAEKTGAGIEIIYDPKVAVRDASALYTDVWTSMGQEAEKEQRKLVMKDYQINDDLLELAAKDHIVLHCLPAHKGEEITTDAFERNAQSIFDQTENRMHAQNALLVSLLKG